MGKHSGGKVGWLWSGGHCPVCPLSAQGSIHSTAGLAGKHLHSAACLKRILPRCTVSQPATLTAYRELREKLFAQHQALHRAA